MPFSTSALLYISRQILIYGGLFLIFIGMFGSLMLIFIFSQRPLSRNPCSIYIVTNAILAFLFLPLFFLPNIVTFGFQINWLAINTPFCKFQMSYGIFTVTAVFIINCLISFDRYAISSRSARIRSISTKKTSICLVIAGVTCAFCLIALPAAILFENVPIGPNLPAVCTSKSTMFLLVAAFVYYPVLEGVLPIVLAVYFWFITRRHVRNLQNLEFATRFDKQITRMLLYQIIVSAIASFPFAAINLYRSLTVQVVRTADQENIVQFIRVMSIWLFYIQYCTDFYIYMKTSSEVRVQFWKIMCLWCRYRNNRVVPIATRTITTRKTFQNNNTNRPTPLKY
ncbi:unnamed protein product [Adineta ricciae]|uniref:G-protein coupled receptors family 1 profile domain-containing protein n=1 Tax=Adineta ricciae TaxID=249248 RepID=A0A813SXW6_ADIRI|nr:unnamed protein product [Adineta ricciae]CAF1324759.1 unnamed protein product [Adineta ricciae]